MKMRIASSLAAPALAAIALLASGCGDCDCHGNGAAGVADLSLTKTVSNAAPNVGDTITFTVTLTDNGPDAATNVQVLDVLPAGLTFVSDVPSQGTYDAVTGVWTVGSVAVGPPQTLIIQATVASASPQTNTASIASVDQSDSSLGNNAASATEIPPGTDLSLIKTVSNAAPNVGDTITWTVTLTNNGAIVATNVVVQDLLPAGLSFVSSSASQGSYNSVTGDWTVGSVANGAPQTLTLTTTVVSPSPQMNTATIGHADQFDPNPGNDTASATAIPQQADLSLIKTVSNATPSVGSNITYTVTSTNVGPNTAGNVTVQDLLPVGLTFVSATPSQGSYSSLTGIWTVGSVTTTTQQTLIITATVVSLSPQTNTATITHADQFDPNTANNSASATETAH